MSRFRFGLVGPFLFLGVPMVDRLRLVGARRDSLAGFSLLLMFFDHLVELVFRPSSLWSVYVFRMPGRFCMPAFAVRVAAALVLRPGGARSYLWRLFLLACVSELPYVWAFGVPVNAVFALFAGGLVGFLLVLSPGCWRARLVGLAALLFFSSVCLLLGQAFEAAYAWLVVCLVLWFAGGSLLALAGAFLCCLGLNVGWVFAVASCAALAWCLWGPVPPLPRLSPRFRYAFYPVHLAALAGVAFLLRVA